MGRMKQISIEIENSKVLQYFEHQIKSNCRHTASNGMKITKMKKEILDLRCYFQRLCETFDEAKKVIAVLETRIKTLEDMR